MRRFEMAVLALSFVLNACGDGSAAGNVDSGVSPITDLGTSDFASSLDGAAPDLSMTSTQDMAPDAAMPTGPLPTGFPELPVPPMPTGNMRQVGNGKQYAKPCDALIAASDGDTILIDAGTYAGGTCRVSANRLTIRGVNGKAIIDINGVKPKECKAIWVLGGSDILIEDVEFTGAHLRPSDPFVQSGACPADKNGAGLRVEGANLTLRRCSFHDNDDGILAGDNAASAILIEYSLFRNNSFDGYSHNLYINHIAQLTFRYNYSGRTNADGHLFKSRAKRSVVVYNRLTGEDGADSYELNFPSGGETYVIGNVIQQGDTTSNRAMLDYASEGFTQGYDNHLYVVNNTFVSRRGAGAVFLQLANTPVCDAVNNLFIGTGSLSNVPANVQSTTNWTDAQGDPLFTDEKGFDFHLKQGSPVAGQGSDPGKSMGGFSLVPVNQYVHPQSAEARPVKAKLDIGAFAAP